MLIIQISELLLKSIDDKIDYQKKKSDFYLIPLFDYAVHIMKCGHQKLEMTVCI